MGLVKWGATPFWRRGRIVDLRQLQEWREMTIYFTRDSFSYDLDRMTNTICR
jgi:hypothetical protein